MYPENFQTKVYTWIWFGHLGALTSHQGISTGNPPSAAWRRQVHIKSDGLEPYKPSFCYQSFIRGLSGLSEFLWHACKFAIVIIQFAVDFYLLGLTMEVQSQGRWKPRKQCLDLNRFTCEPQFIRHAIASQTHLSVWASSKPLSKLNPFFQTLPCRQLHHPCKETKGTSFHLGWWAPLVGCSYFCLLCLTTASAVQFCSLWDRACHFVLWLLWWGPAPRQRMLGSKVIKINK